jgi:sensor histidine kinase YesM
MDNIIVLDIGLIVTAVTLIGSIITFFKYVVKLNKRFEELERHDKMDYDALYVLTKGMNASLNGLKQLGANGDVLSAAQELQEYLMRPRG